MDVFCQKSSIFTSVCYKYEDPSIKRFSCCSSATACTPGIMVISAKVYGVEDHTSRSSCWDGVIVVVDIAAKAAAATLK